MAHTHKHKHTNTNTNTHLYQLKQAEKNNTQVKRIPYAIDNFQTPTTTKTHYNNRSLLLPRRGSSRAVSAPNRRNTSPASSSCVATTVTIMLVEPLTCAVYCSVNIAQRKHHSRVQAPVAPPKKTQHNTTQHASTTTSHKHTLTQKITHYTFFSLSRPTA